MTRAALNRKGENDAETFFKSGRGAGVGDRCQNAGWRKTVGKIGFGYPGWSAGYVRAMVLAACETN